MICKTVVAILALSCLGSSSPGYPSVLLRCSQCLEDGLEGSGEDSGEVCGSDWKTYSSLCQLEWEACKRNWRIVQVSEGPCVSQCQEVELGKLDNGELEHFNFDHRSTRYVLCYGNISGVKQGELHPRLLQVQETFKTTRTRGTGSKGMLSRKVSSHNHRN